MHKISFETIRNLASEIEKWETLPDTATILEKARKLYEMSVLLHHQKEMETETDEDILFGKIDEITSEEELGFSIGQEEVTEEKTTYIEPPAPFFEEPKTTAPPAVELVFSESPEESAQDIIQAPDPLAKAKKPMPQLSLEEEMKSSVSANFAADLFENPEKNNPLKKSLNDKLSQNQIQIGLNDRIGFVKHLFNGSLEDFNRVVSQLNTFETEEQAKDFINRFVRTDYQWEAESEYELRFLQLIERRFV